MSTLWKCLVQDMRSAHGSAQWRVGEWKEIKGSLSLCNVGFHASPTPLMAMGYVNPVFMCEVEVGGDKRSDKDKSCHQKMVVRRAWKWDKEDSVALAIFAAELVLHIFEDKYPKDRRPREAIEAAKLWLRKPTAAGDARAAAWAAGDAAGAAAWAAGDAAGHREICDKCNAFVIERLAAKLQVS